MQMVVLLSPSFAYQGMPLIIQLNGSLVTLNEIPSNNNRRLFTAEIPLIEDLSDENPNHGVIIPGFQAGLLRIWDLGWVSSTLDNSGKVPEDIQKWRILFSHPVGPERCYIALWRILHKA